MFEDERKDDKQLADDVSHLSDDAQPEEGPAQHDLLADGPEWMIRAKAWWRSQVSDVKNAITESSDPGESPTEQSQGTGPGNYADINAEMAAAEYTCLHCGLAISPEANFCPACGVPNRPPVVEVIDVANQRKVCVGCGTIHENTARFCYNCGLDLPSKGVALPQAAGNPAGFWIRLGAYIIDLIVISLFNVLLLSAIGVDLSDWYAGTSTWYDPLITLAIEITYFTVLIGTWGQTMGKSALGLKVVRPDGSQLSYPRSFGRAIAWYVSFLVVGLGFVAITLSPRKRAWHDLMVGTQVLRTRL
jgi:uncharacterized RDD family membrane protein YckC/RNA polymerase subunit RPABC4/transcription elongation factor Spt4